MTKIVEERFWAFSFFLFATHLKRIDQAQTLYRFFPVFFSPRFIRLTNTWQAARVFSEFLLRVKNALYNFIL